MDGEAKLSQERTASVAVSENIPLDQRSSDGLSPGVDQSRSVDEEGTSAKEPTDWKAGQKETNAVKGMYDACALDQASTYMYMYIILSAEGMCLHMYMHIHCKKAQCLVIVYQSYVQLYMYMKRGSLPVPLWFINPYVQCI